MRLMRVKGGMMHQTSPGVERAVAAARGWADRLGSEPVRLAHLVLALLDEEEGRPAVLLERLGLTVARLRQELTNLDSPPAPPLTALFNAARAWSIVHRHDPEFLTDALLIAVLTADVGFRDTCATLGFPVEILERSLTNATTANVPEVESGVFEPLDATAEMDAARILDAGFNRAREAARVLEDYCRFALDDRFLTEQLKELRHGLVDAARKLPQNAIVASRETRRDVGAAVTAGTEYERTSAAHVALVNLKRLQEALRSIEEFGKVFSPDLGRDLEALRYRTYTLERAIVLGASSRERLAAARLYVLISRAQCSGALDWTIREAARGGVDVFQLREKALPDRELLECARAVRRWTREVGALFVVNDRPDIARLSEADGVHLGQDDLTPKDARRIVGPDALIGISTHSVEQLRSAVLDGADYVGIGPTFHSKTKSFDHFPGLEFVRSASAETGLPAFALGGIGPENIAAVVAAGARRVAVGAAICAADDPERAARVLRAALPQ
jgi:thiamine-phosphate pyrophosphorylase